MSTPQATLRAKIRERDGDNCSICGKIIDFALPPGAFMGPSLEHVIPLAAAGSRSDLENLRLAHMYPCNRDKGAVHDGMDFAKRDVRRRLQRDSRHRLRSLAVDCEFESWSAARL